MEISIKLDENILPEAQFNLRSFTILTAIYTPPPFQCKWGIDNKL